MVEMAPLESTVYDFDGQCMRPELVKVNIATMADYNDGMTKAKDGLYPKVAYKF